MFKRVREMAEALGTTLLLKAHRDSPQVIAQSPLVEELAEMAEVLGADRTLSDLQILTVLRDRAGRHRIALLEASKMFDGCEGRLLQRAYLALQAAYGDSDGIQTFSPQEETLFDELDSLMALPDDEALAYLKALEPRLEELETRWRARLSKPSDAEHTTELTLQFRDDVSSIVGPQSLSSVPLLRTASAEQTAFGVMGKGLGLTLLTIDDLRSLSENPESL